MPYNLAAKSAAQVRNSCAASLIPFSFVTDENGQHVLRGHLAKANPKLADFAKRSENAGNLPRAEILYQPHSVYNVPPLFEQI
ncbi:FMN-binding negative transcriptional regulator [Nitrosomonas sp.]|uniref:FMN-binding negative transcriptional regulator n=1 Tax=Nitrosomonas sp. TaxID=42353 RepID=UPI0032EEA66A